MAKAVGVAAAHQFETLTSECIDALTYAEMCLTGGEVVRPGCLGTPSSASCIKRLSPDSFQFNTILSDLKILFAKLEALLSVVGFECDSGNELVKDLRQRLAMLVQTTVAANKRDAGSNVTQTEEATPDDWEIVGDEGLDEDNSNTFEQQYEASQQQGRGSEKRKHSTLENLKPEIAEMVRPFEELLGVASNKSGGTDLVRTHIETIRSTLDSMTAASARPKISQLLDAASPTSDCFLAKTSGTWRIFILEAMELLGLPKTALNELKARYRLRPADIKDSKDIQASLCFLRKIRKSWKQSVRSTEESQWSSKKARTQ